MAKSILKSILLSILLCIFTFSLYAQAAKHISFAHLGVNEGLSQSTIFDIVQDRQGNMWFATYDGLNKYDGYDFTVYQHDEQNPYSIGCDITRSCMVDSQGNLWIGTEEGLSLYDASQDKFYNYHYQKNRPISGIVEISENQLLLFSNKSKSLLLFDTETQQFSNEPLHPSLLSISPTTISRQGDNVYIGSYKGVFVYSISRKTLKDITPNELQDKQILAILQQSPICLWIGTEGHGLYKVNPQTKETTNYVNTPGKKGGISSNYIRSLALDSQNDLWIGTINSLNTYNETTDSFDSYTSDTEVNGSLSQTSVRDIFMDSQGGMWLGTFYGGLNYYHPLKNRFQNIRSIPKTNSLNSNIIGCIKEDKHKKLWIGTNNGGLNFYDPQTCQFVHYTRKDGLASNDVKAIYVDEAQNLVYIGTHTGGLSILHRNSGRIETFNQRATRNIYDIEPAINGDLWLTGMTVLIRFNPQKKTLTRITAQSDGRPLAQEEFTYILRDSQQRLWMGSEKGMNVYTENKDGLLVCPILPEGFPIRHKAVTAIHEAHNGIFWIGTRSGLFRFDENKKEYKQYTTADGLPNNVIHGILEDANGGLWLSTNKGLSRLQPETEKFRNYTDNDGLQSNQFTNNAHCRTADGQMYFGGINGITLFHPEQIVDNPYTPPVVITQLHLFNRRVFPNDDTGILKTDISGTKSITLSSKQSMFSLDFVVSNYISGNHNTFAYMLKGFDKEWYYSNNLRTVSYSNLPQGTYHFMVKAANNDGKWNTTPTVLEIVILPVWYKTWWAVILFLATFAGFVTFVFRFFWMRKKMEAELEIERRDKEHREEINQMKMRFFINISHELRTPLTLILAPLQEVISKINDRWTRNQLEYIQRNANRLLHLVNQLMDYRRAELGVFELKIKKGNAYRLIRENFLYYDKLARHKEIHYAFHSDLEEKEELFDPNYLELIVNNLLSNAFKYTDNGKSITVTLKEENNWLILQVSDTGAGIPINKQGKVFERFYQIESQHIGSGIGLSLVQRLVDLHHGRIELESEEGKGSTFSVYLPQDLAVYKATELAGSNTSKEEEQVYSTNSKEMYFIDTEKMENEAIETGDKKRGTILIVEDNQEIRHYLSSGLAALFNILEAGNGEEALEKLKNHEADIIITDVMMPVMDGIKLCKNIKQNIRTCHIPVIILSAKTDIKDQLEGLQVGADDYISKPFSIAVLTSKIQNMMRTRRHMLEKYAKSLEVEPEKITFNAMDEELLKRAVSIVEENIDNFEFSTDEFAQKMNMSRSNLHLKLKAITGESAIDFIRKVRFKRATELLKSGRYTVTEVSSMVGFNSSSYFATCFKKYIGCLPTEYIKKVKG